jgi:hypothetical protein
LKPKIGAKTAKPKIERDETKKFRELTTETKVALDREPFGGGESPLKFKLGLKKNKTQGSSIQKN